MQNNLLVRISLVLLFTSLLSAEFISPYADSAFQSTEDRLEKTSLKSLELQKEIARKKAIEDAKIAKAKKIKDAKIAKHFASESDLKKTEAKMNNISKAQDIKFKAAPIEEENAPVNLEKKREKQDDAFLNSLKNSATTMKME